MDELLLAAEKNAKKWRDRYFLLTEAMRISDLILLDEKFVEWQKEAEKSIRMIDGAKYLMSLNIDNVE